MTRFEGQVALITGAARGQGRSHAVRLAEEGADIIAIDICKQIDTVPYPMATPEDLEETVRLVEKTGRRVLALQADVRSSAEIQAAVDAGITQFGRIDIVVANAGITGISPLINVTDEQWDNILGVCLTGVFKTARAVLPPMLEAGRGGSVIFTGSTASLVGFGDAAPYAAAKHGLIGLMRSLVNEVSGANIRVNTILPTSVNTEMLINDWMFEKQCPDNPSEAGMAEVLGGEHVMNVPWVDPIDMSNAVVWLASEESRYVTGVSLPIDAGKTSKSR